MLFVFSLDTEEKYYNEGNCIFSNQGELLGRILKCSKVEISEEKVIYSYDIESTKEVYEKVENGEINIWKLKQYSVYPGTTCYYRKGNF